MPTPKKGARLGAGPAHQRLMVAGLATQLFEHGRITTTEAKARVLRPVAEKLITKAKKAELGTVESLHHRRQVLRTIHDKSVVHSLFEEIAPRFAERPGGYTRITKIGPRKGDNAPVAVIELVTEDYTPTARSSAAATPAATPAAETSETPEAEAPEATETSEAPEAEVTEAESTETSEASQSPAETETAEADSEEPTAEESQDDTKA